jgi:hypothetical protein
MCASGIGSAELRADIARNETKSAPPQSLHTALFKLAFPALISTEMPNEFTI